MNMAQGAGSRRAARTERSAAQVEQNGKHEGGVAQNMIELDFLRGLIEAVDQSGIDSLEINRAGTRIRIAKTPTVAPMAFPPMMPQSPAMSTPPALPAADPAAAATAAPPGGSAEPGAPAAAPASNLVDIKSPMVGTFYRAPAPDAPAYVEVGSQVSKGQTLCILEAMKLMNELECEVDGVIRQILIEDADPVEFGQVLFRVEPSK
jgi:acetyl-CoA carboxylase biotin carboxyl carrier protein